MLKLQQYQAYVYTTSLIRLQKLIRCHYCKIMEIILFCMVKYSNIQFMVVSVNNQPIFMTKVIEVIISVICVIIFTMERDIFLYI